MQEPPVHDIGVHYSTAQKYVLQYIVYLTAPLSVVGSSLIIFVIFHERKSLAKSVYHRILLGMSTLDFLNSSGIIVFGPWAIPEESIDYVVNARGSFTTCAVSGFFLNLIFGTMFYSGTLALYFLMMIRFGKKEEWIARYIEPVGHFLAIGQPLSTGIIGVVNDYFNAMPMLPGWCWFSNYPAYCDYYDDVECTRGPDKDPLQVLAGGIHFYILILFVIVVSMVLIFLKVRETERRIQQYAGHADHNFERTKEVGRQGLLYIGAFMLTYLPIAGSQLVSLSATRANFAFAFLTKTLSVLQGFFNCIIFLRNQYRSLTAQGQPLYFLRRIALAHAEHKENGEGNEESRNTVENENVLVPEAQDAQ